MIIIYDQKSCIKNNRIICIDKLYHHWGYTNIKLIKKINQSKYIFKCLACDNIFTVIIKHPNLICDKCYESGFVPSCDKCKGTGFIDWIENVIGKQEERSIIWGQTSVTPFIVTFPKLNLNLPPFSFDSLNQCKQKNK
jgi:hypothetical protein